MANELEVGRLAIHRADDDGLNMDGASGLKELRNSTNMLDRVSDMMT